MNWANRSFDPGHRKAASAGFSILTAAALAISAAQDHVGAVARADPPSTMPDVRFADDSRFVQSFKRLTDADPKIRDRAVVELMGMSADDLPAFRRLVEQSRPLLPNQAEPLRDIVEQVFLAGEKYDVATGETDTSGTQSPYFLGVVWPKTFDMANARLGVPITRRLPGFPSFRYLRDGDMILGVCLDPALPLFQPPNAETHLSGSLAEKLTLVSQTVTLLVLRDGEQVRISIRLAPRPVAANSESAAEAVNAFLAARTRRADDYWNENFEPLLRVEAGINLE